ncbi:redox-sensing transcriptional repressor Rex [Deinococcus sp. KNUC1210]|uniref:redox-sensing transcriptional repressor Rex n=1 Tax=Deinococcus sp. KNUC1210 TaxID=2917691 RepID=UPI001EF0CE3E|nr:redox-sensing transcriptional repressor Rex [Deinococcus sp. KNUC1210]ULH15693.1 redox-sensing transcriptional repressor Rex [Deinococcus sp. KNUC1210]
MSSQDIPTAAISRLVIYLRILEALEAAEISRTSSSDLAERAQVTAFQVRKDLAYFGRFGTRGMGYTVPLLKRELMRVLGLNRTWNVVIMGMGRLGQAVANYPGASDYQFGYVGLFDIDPDLVGREIRGLKVQHADELKGFVQTRSVDLGFLAVPPEHAQAAAQTLVSAGIRGILNFAPTMIQPRLIPGSSEVESEWKAVSVENVDFLAGMKRLAFYTLNPHLRPSELKPSELSSNELEA